MLKKIISILIISTGLYAQQWTDPSRGTIDYVYVGAPGMFSSAVQFAKLTPSFTLPTGQIAKGSRGIITVPDTVTAVNFAEISPRGSVSQELFLCAGQAASLFSLTLCLQMAHHDFSLSYPLAGDDLAYGLTLAWRPFNFLVSHLANKKFGITVGASSHGESLEQHAVDIFKVNVAQDDDIALYIDAVQKQLAVGGGKPKKAIMYGISRGSATVFESFAQLDSENKAGDIAAVVCEGIFDSVPNIIKHAPFLQRTKLKLLMALPFSRFKKDGPSPLAWVDKIITKDKPIAIITSKADGEVPYKNTLNLYNKLIEKGHTNIHLLVLEHSSHTEYPVGAEKEKYQNFMHAFYRKYNLPHIQAYADLIEPLD
jgi:hypothetical protein